MNTPTQGSRRADDRTEDAAVVIGDGDKLINVVLLNGERLNVRVQSVATGQDLYNTISEHLGLSETIFFGLMIIKDGEHEFLDLNDKLSKLAKYAPHLWKDDVSCNSSLVFTIFFRVKYYVENICLLQQQSTRHLYYLQLRKDVLEGAIFVHEETAMLLASYALQAEVGDYNQSVHGNDYFVPEHYLPQRAIAKLTASYIRNTLPQLHKAHTGISDAQAEIEYLKEAQKLQEYGIIFNKVSKYKKDKRGSYSLGISVRGLIVYEERGLVKSPVFRHPWQNIKRMAFHRRRFFIEAHGPPDTSKIVLYTISYKKSRYLLKMCTSFYKFQMMMGMKLSSLREFPKDGSVKMNGVVRTDASDSPGRGSPVSDVAKLPNMEHSVIQPSGVGPAIHLNGSATPVQEPHASDQPVQVSIYPVQLQKFNGSLGLNIIGGIELGGIYVKTMAHDGSAALSGKINIGDRILEINGQSLEGITRQDAVNLLRTAPQVCILLIESCVATPATPNGKPAVPGNYSTTAFHQPSKSQPQAGMPDQHYPDPHGSPQHQYYTPAYSEQTQLGSGDQYSDDSSVVSILAKNVLYILGWETGRRFRHQVYSPHFRRAPSQPQPRTRASYYASDRSPDPYWGQQYQNSPNQHYRPVSRPRSDEGWRSGEDNRYRNLSSGSGRESDTILESGYQSQVQIPSVVHDNSMTPELDYAEYNDPRTKRGNVLEMKLYRYEERRQSEVYSVDSSFFSSMNEDHEGYDDATSGDIEGRCTEEFIPQGSRDHPSPSRHTHARYDNEDDIRELYSREEPGIVTRFFNYLGFENQEGQQHPQRYDEYNNNEPISSNNIEYVYDQVNQLTEKIHAMPNRTVEMKVFKRTESEDDYSYPVGPRVAYDEDTDDQLRYQYSKTLQTSRMLYDEEAEFGHYGDTLPQHAKQERYNRAKTQSLSMDNPNYSSEDENVGMFGERVEPPPKSKQQKAFSWFDRDSYTTTSPEKEPKSRLASLFSSSDSRRQDSVDSYESSDARRTGDVTEKGTPSLKQTESSQDPSSPGRTGLFAKTKTSWWSTSLDETKTAASRIGNFFSYGQTLSSVTQPTEIKEGKIPPRDETPSIVKDDKSAIVQDQKPTVIREVPVKDIGTTAVSRELAALSQTDIHKGIKGMPREDYYSLGTRNTGGTAVTRELAALSQLDVRDVNKDLDVLAAKRSQSVRSLPRTSSLSWPEEEDRSTAIYKTFESKATDEPSKMQQQVKTSEPVPEKPEKVVSSATVTATARDVRADERSGFFGGFFTSTPPSKLESATQITAESQKRERSASEEMSLSRNEQTRRRSDQGVTQKTEIKKQPRQAETSGPAQERSSQKPEERSSFFGGLFSSAQPSKPTQTSQVKAENLNNETRTGEKKVPVRAGSTHSASVPDQRGATQTTQKKAETRQAQNTAEQKKAETREKQKTETQKKEQPQAPPPSGQLPKTPTFSWFSSQNTGVATEGVTTASEGVGSFFGGLFSSSASKSTSSSSTGQPSKLEKTQENKHAATKDASATKIQPDTRTVKETVSNSRSAVPTANVTPSSAPAAKGSVQRHSEPSQPPLSKSAATQKSEEGVFSKMMFSFKGVFTGNETDTTKPETNKETPVPIVLPASKPAPERQHPNKTQQSLDSTQVRTLPIAQMKSTEERSRSTSTRQSTGATSEQHKLRQLDIIKVRKYAKRWLKKTRDRKLGRRRRVSEGEQFRLVAEAALEKERRLSDQYNQQGRKRELVGADRLRSSTDFDDEVRRLRMKMKNITNDIEHADEKRPESVDCRAESEVESESERFVRSLERKRNKIDDTWDTIMRDIDQTPTKEIKEEASTAVRVAQCDRSNLISDQEVTPVEGVSLMDEPDSPEAIQAMASLKESVAQVVYGISPAKTDTSSSISSAHSSDRLDEKDTLTSQEWKALDKDSNRDNKIEQAKYRDPEKLTKPSDQKQDSAGPKNVLSNPSTGSPKPVFKNKNIRETKKDPTEELLSKLLNEPDSEEEDEGLFSKLIFGVKEVLAFDEQEVKKDSPPVQRSPQLNAARQAKIKEEEEAFTDMVSKFKNKYRQETGPDQPSSNGVTQTLPTAVTRTDLPRDVKPTQVSEKIHSEVSANGYDEKIQTNGLQFETKHKQQVGPHKKLSSEKQKLHDARSPRENLLSETTRKQEQMKDAEVTIKQVTKQVSSEHNLTTDASAPIHYSGIGVKPKEEVQIKMTKADELSRKPLIESQSKHHDAKARERSNDQNGQPEGSGNEGMFAKLMFGFKEILSTDVEESKPVHTKVEQTTKPPPSPTKQAKIQAENDAFTDMVSQFKGKYKKDSSSPTAKKSVGKTTPEGRLPQETVLDTRKKQEQLVTKKAKEDIHSKTKSEVTTGKVQPDVAKTISKVTEKRAADVQMARKTDMQPVVNEKAKGAVSVPLEALKEHEMEPVEEEADTFSKLVFKFRAFSGKTSTSDQVAAQDRAKAKESNPPAVTSDKSHKPVTQPQVAKKADLPSKQSKEIRQAKDTNEKKQIHSTVFSSTAESPKPKPVHKQDVKANEGLFSKIVFRRDAKEKAAKAALEAEMKRQRYMRAKTNWRRAIAAVTKARKEKEAREAAEKEEARKKAEESGFSKLMLRFMGTESKEKQTSKQPKDTKTEPAFVPTPPKQTSERWEKLISAVKEGKIEDQREQKPESTLSKLVFSLTGASKKDTKDFGQDKVSTEGDTKKSVDKNVEEGASEKHQEEDGKLFRFVSRFTETSHRKDEKEIQTSKTTKPIEKVQPEDRRPETSTQEQKAAWKDVSSKATQDKDKPQSKKEQRGEERMLFKLVSRLTEPTQQGKPEPKPTHGVPASQEKVIGEAGKGKQKAGIPREDATFKSTPPHQIRELPKTESKPRKSDSKSENLRPDSLPVTPTATFEDQPKEEAKEGLFSRFVSMMADDTPHDQKSKVKRESTITTASKPEEKKTDKITATKASSEMEKQSVKITESRKAKDVHVSSSDPKATQQRKEKKSEVPSHGKGDKKEPEEGLFSKLPFRLTADTSQPKKSHKEDTSSPDHSKTPQKQPHEKEYKPVESKGTRVNEIRQPLHKTETSDVTQKEQPVEEGFFSRFGFKTSAVQKQEPPSNNSISVQDTNAAKALPKVPINQRGVPQSKVGKSPETDVKMETTKAEKTTEHKPTQKSESLFSRFGFGTGESAPSEARDENKEKVVNKPQQPLSKQMSKKEIQPEIVTSTTSSNLSETMPGVKEKTVRQGNQSGETKKAEEGRLSRFISSMLTETPKEEIKKQPVPQTEPLKADDRTKENIFTQQNRKEPTKEETKVNAPPKMKTEKPEDGLFSKLMFKKTEARPEEAIVSTESEKVQGPPPKGLGKTEKPEITEKEILASKGGTSVGITKETKREEGRFSKLLTSMLAESDREDEQKVEDKQSRAHPEVTKSGTPSKQRQDNINSQTSSMKPATHSTTETKSAFSKDERSKVNINDSQKKAQEGRFSKMLSSMMAEKSKTDDTPTPSQTSARTEHIRQTMTPVTEVKEKDTKPVIAQKVKSDSSEATKSEGRFSKFLTAMLAEPVKKDDEEKGTIKVEEKFEQRRENVDTNVRAESSIVKERVLQREVRKESVDEKPSGKDSKKPDAGRFSKLLTRVIAEQRIDESQQKSREVQANDQPAFSEKGRKVRETDRPSHPSSKEGLFSTLVSRMAAENSKTQADSNKDLQGKTSMQTQKTAMRTNEKGQERQKAEEGLKSGLSGVEKKDQTSTKKTGEGYFSKFVTGLIADAEDKEPKQETVDKKFSSTKFDKGPKAMGGTTERTDESRFSKLVFKVVGEPVQNRSTDVKSDSAGKKNYPITSEAKDPHAPKQEEQSEGLFSKIVLQLKADQKERQPETSQKQGTIRQKVHEEKVVKDSQELKRDVIAGMKRQEKKTTTKNNERNQEESLPPASGSVREEPIIADLSQTVMSGAFGRSDIFIPKESSSRKTKPQRRTTDSKYKTQGWEKVREAIERGTFSGQPKDDKKSFKPLERQLPKDQQSTDRSSGWKKVLSAIHKGKIKEQDDKEKDKTIKEKAAGQLPSRLKKLKGALPKRMFGEQISDQNVKVACRPRSVGWHKVRAAIDQGKFRSYVLKEQYRKRHILLLAKKRKERRLGCYARSPGWKKVKSAIVDGKFKTYKLQQEERSRKIMIFMSKQQERRLACNARSSGWKKVKSAIARGKFRAYIFKEQERTKKIVEFIERRQKWRERCFARSSGWKKVKAAIASGKLRAYVLQEQERTKKILQFMNRRQHKRSQCCARSPGWKNVKAAIALGKFRAYVLQEEERTKKILQFMDRRLQKKAQCKAKSLGWKKLKGAIAFGKFRAYILQEEGRKRKILEFMERRQKQRAQCYARSSGWKKVKAAIACGRFRAYILQEQERAREILEFMQRRQHKRAQCYATCSGWKKVKSAIAFGKFRAYTLQEQERARKILEFMERLQNNRAQCYAKSTGWKKVKFAIVLGKFSAYVLQEQERTRKIIQFMERRQQEKSQCNARSLGWKKVKGAIAFGKFRACVLQEEERTRKILQFMERRQHKRATCHARSSGWKKVKCAIAFGKFRAYMFKEQERTRTILEFIERRQKQRAQCYARSSGWKKVKTAIVFGRFRAYILQEEELTRKVLEFMQRLQKKRAQCNATSSGWKKVKAAIAFGKFRAYIIQEQERTRKILKFMRKRQRKRAQCNAKSAGWKKVKSSIALGKFSAYVLLQRERARKILQFVERRQRKRAQCLANSPGWKKVKSAIALGKFRAYILQEQERSKRIVEFMKKRQLKKARCRARSRGWKKVKAAIVFGKFRAYNLQEQERTRKILEFMERCQTKRAQCFAKSLGWRKVKTAIALGKFHAHVLQEQERTKRILEFMKRRQQKRAHSIAKSLGWKKVKAAIALGKFRAYILQEEERTKKILEFMKRRQQKKASCFAKSEGWKKVKFAIAMGKFKAYILQERERTRKILAFIQRRQRKSAQCYARSSGWRKVKVAIAFGKVRAYILQEQERTKKILEFMERQQSKRALCCATSLGWKKVKSAITLGKFRAYTLQEQERTRKIVQFLERRQQKRAQCVANSSGWKKVKYAIALGKFRAYILHEQERTKRILEFMERRQMDRSRCHARSPGWKKLKAAIAFGKFSAYNLQEQERTRKILDFMERRQKKRTQCYAISPGWKKLKTVIALGKFHAYVLQEQERTRRILEFMRRRQQKSAQCNAKSLGWKKVKGSIAFGKFRAYILQEEERKKKIVQFMKRRQQKSAQCNAKSLGWKKVKGAIAFGKFRAYILQEEERTKKIVQFMKRRQEKSAQCNAKSLGWKKVKTAIAFGKFRAYILQEEERKKKIVQFMKRRQQKSAQCNAKSLGWKKVKGAIALGKFRAYILQEEERTKKIVHFMKRRQQKSTQCNAKSLGWKKVKGAIAFGKFRAYILQEEERTKKIVQFMKRRQEKSAQCNAKSLGWKKVKAAVAFGKFRAYILQEEERTKKIVQFMKRRQEKSAQCNAKSLGWKKVKAAITFGKFRAYILQEEERTKKIVQFMKRIQEKQRQQQQRAYCKAKSSGWKKVKSAISLGKFHAHVLHDEERARKVVEFLEKRGYHQTKCRAKSVGWWKVRSAIDRGLFKEFHRKTAEKTDTVSQFFIDMGVSDKWKQVKTAMERGTLKDLMDDKEVPVSQTDQTSTESKPSTQKPEESMFSRFWSKVTENTADTKHDSPKERSMSDKTQTDVPQASVVAGRLGVTKDLHKEGKQETKTQAPSTEEEETSLSSLLGRFRSSFLSDKPDAKKQEKAKSKASIETKHRSSPRDARRKRKDNTGKSSKKQPPSYGYGFRTFEIRQDAINQFVNTTEQLVQKIETKEERRARKRDELRQKSQPKSDIKMRNVSGKDRFIVIVKKVIRANKVAKMAQPAEKSNKITGKEKFILAVKAVIRANRIAKSSQKGPTIKGKARFIVVVRAVIRMNRMGKTSQGDKLRGKARFVWAVKSVIRANRMAQDGKKLCGKERFISAARAVIRANRMSKGKKGTGKARFIAAAKTIIKTNRLAKAEREKKLSAKERFISAVKAVITANRLNKKEGKKGTGKARFIAAVKTIIRTNRITKTRRDKKISGKEKFISAVKTVIRVNRLEKTEQGKRVTGKARFIWAVRAIIRIQRAAAKKKHSHKQVAAESRHAKPQDYESGYKGPYQRRFEAREAERLRRDNRKPEVKSTFNIQESPLDGISEEALFAVVEEDSKKAAAMLDYRGPYQRKFEAREAERKLSATLRRQRTEQRLPKKKGSKEADPWSERMARISQKMYEAERTKSVDVGKQAGKEPGKEPGKGSEHKVRKPLQRQPSSKEKATGKATFVLAAKAVAKTESGARQAGSSAQVKTGRERATTGSADQSTAKKLPKLKETVIQAEQLKQLAHQEFVKQDILPGKKVDATSASGFPKTVAENAEFEETKKERPLRPSPLLPGRGSDIYEYKGPYQLRFEAKEAERLKREMSKHQDSRGNRQSHDNDNAVEVGKEEERETQRYKGPYETRFEAKERQRQLAKLKEQNAASSRLKRGSSRDEHSDVWSERMLRVNKMAKEAERMKAGDSTQNEKSSSPNISRPVAATREARLASQISIKRDKDKKDEKQVVEPQLVKLKEKEQLPEQSHSEQSTRSELGVDCSKAAPSRLKKGSSRDEHSDVWSERMLRVSKMAKEAERMKAGDSTQNEKSSSPKICRPVAATREARLARQISTKREKDKKDEMQVVEPQLVKLKEEQLPEQSHTEQSTRSELGVDCSKAAPSRLKKGSSRDEHSDVWSERMLRISKMAKEAERNKAEVSTQNGKSSSPKICRPVAATREARLARLISTKREKDKKDERQVVEPQLVKLKGEEQLPEQSHAEQSTKSELRVDKGPHQREFEAKMAALKKEQQLMATTYPEERKGQIKKHQIHQESKDSSQNFVRKHEIDDTFKQQQDLPEEQHLRQQEVSQSSPEQAGMSGTTRREAGPISKSGQSSQSTSVHAEKGMGSPLGASENEEKQPSETGEVSKENEKEDTKPPPSKTEKPKETTTSETVAGLIKWGRSWFS